MTSGHRLFSQVPALGQFAERRFSTLSSVLADSLVESTIEAVASVMRVMIDIEKEEKINKKHGKGKRGVD